MVDFFDLDVLTQVKLLEDSILGEFSSVPAGYTLDSGTWCLPYYISPHLAGLLFLCGVVETRFDRLEGFAFKTLADNRLDHHVTYVQFSTAPQGKLYLRQLEIEPGSLPSNIMNRLRRKSCPVIETKG